MLSNNTVKKVFLGSMILVLVTGLSSPIPVFAPFNPGFDIFGNPSTGLGPVLIEQWDPLFGTLIGSFPPNCGVGFLDGRGIAYDGTNLWISCIGSGFVGEGVIHIQPTTGGPDITTLPDPYGAGSRGIGAMDWDPFTSTMLAISYLPVTGLEEVSVLSPAGVVLASCDVPFGGGGVGTATLALDPAGATFWTNAGEASLTFLDEYVLPVAVGAGLCVPGASAVGMPVGVEGVDFDLAGDLIVSSFLADTTSDLDVFPWGAIDSSFSNAATTQRMEDITIVPIDSVQVGGEHFNLDTTALLISGLMMNAIWIVPAAAGIAGAGMYLTKSKWSKPHN